MPVITLLTDFGTEDEYVGVMKGVMLSIQPKAAIVDITHQVPPHHIVQAARILTASYAYFPVGTVHVTVVDPGVGTARRIIALQKAGHLFLAPDNGVLSVLLENGGITFAVEVENEVFFLKPVSRTFHGRDIFAPVAAHLAKGIPLQRLGPEIGVDQLVRIEIVKPYISDTGDIHGSIVAIDRFGNLITDIDIRLLNEITDRFDHSRVIVHVSGQSISGLSNGYDTTNKGSPLAVIGSRDCLEIAVNRGAAKANFHAEIGDKVRVSVLE